MVTWGWPVWVMRSSYCIGLGGHRLGGYCSQRKQQVLLMSLYLLQLDFMSKYWRRIHSLLLSLRPKQVCGRKQDTWCMYMEQKTLGYPLTEWSRKNCSFLVKWGGGSQPWQREYQELLAPSYWVRLEPFRITLVWNITHKSDLMKY